MLRRIKIQNFKSIGEPGVDLELKPLTILVGPNGGGKSSILKAVAFAGQEFNIDRELVAFPSKEDMVHKRKSAVAVVIDIYFSDSWAEVEGQKVTGYRWMSKADDTGEANYALVNGSATTSDPARQAARKLASNGLVGNTFFLASTRGSVKHTYGFEGNPIWVGRNGEFLLPLLARIFGRHEYEVTASGIRMWACRFGHTDLTAGY